MQKLARWPSILMVGLSLVTVGRSETPKTEKSSARSGGKTVTYYFMDWNDVEKGRLVPIYDTNRLTADAFKGFEAQKKDWNIDTHFGKHGFYSYHMPQGIRITVEQAKKSERWLVADRPWEDDVSGGNVLFDEGKYRCWYSTSIPNIKVGVVFAEEGRAMETNGVASCYAESTDGFHWTKPSLKIYSINGSSDNNMVSGIWIDTPFRDDHGKAEQRYKAFTFDELPADEVPKGAGSFGKYGLYGLVSPDGYHWTRLPKPLVRHFADTWNIGGWDPTINKYVGYFRGHTGGRSITRAETDDFMNWPMPQTVFCVGSEEAPVEDYYSSGFTTYPGVPTIRLMFPGIYHLNTSKIDSRVAISRDGQGWNWVSHDIVISNGKEGDWDAGMLFGQPNLLRLPDGRLGLPYSGYDTGHEIGFNNVYKDWPKSKTGLAWAIWDDARIAGIEAAKTGEFFANNPITTASQILVNARAASGGKIEAELVTKDNVIPGYSFADSIPLKGDNVWTPLRWKGKSGLDEVKGKKVQIHFRLHKAKIFAYRTK